MEAGSLVECINGRFGQRAIDYRVTMPKKGGIYTVRAIVFDSNFDYEGSPGVLLEEIVNSRHWFESGETGERYYLEPRYYISRFREVQPPMDMGFILEKEQEDCCAI